MPTSSCLIHNRLLAAFPPSAFNRLSPHLELIEMQLGDALCNSHSHIYFPTTSLISLRTLLSGGALAEIAAVGNEGIVGIPQFLLGKIPPFQGVVRSAGQGYRVNAQIMQSEYNRGGAMLRLLLRYAKALNNEMVQASVCIQSHSVEQKLCRWLLLNVDRQHLNYPTITQESLTNFLGERGEVINASILQLQQAGALRDRNGVIEILDRKRLETVACACYGLTKAGFDCLHSTIAGVDTTVIHHLFDRRANDGRREKIDPPDHHDHANRAALHDRRTAVDRSTNDPSCE